MNAPTPASLESLFDDSLEAAQQPEWPDKTKLDLAVKERSPKLLEVRHFGSRVEIALKHLQELQLTRFEIA
jgi:hypothetical protein